MRSGRLSLARPSRVARSAQFLLGDGADVLRGEGVEGDDGVDAVEELGAEEAPWLRPS